MAMAEILFVGVLGTLLGALIAYGIMRNKNLLNKFISNYTEEGRKKRKILENPQELCKRLNEGLDKIVDMGDEMRYDVVEVDGKEELKLKIKPFKAPVEEKEVKAKPPKAPVEEKEVKDKPLKNEGGKLKPCLICQKKTEMKFCSSEHIEAWNRKQQKIKDKAQNKGG